MIFQEMSWYVNCVFGVGLDELKGFRNNIKGQLKKVRFLIAY